VRENAVAGDTPGDEAELPPAPAAAGPLEEDVPKSEPARVDVLEPSDLLVLDPSDPLALDFPVFPELDGSLAVLGVLGMLGLLAVVGPVEPAEVSGPAPSRVFEVDPSEGDEPDDGGPEGELEEGRLAESDEELAAFEAVLDSLDEDDGFPVADWAEVEDGEWADVKVGVLELRVSVSAERDRLELDGAAALDDSGAADM